MLTGGLIDPLVSTNLLKEELLNFDISKGFIIDGYPRALNQLEYFNRLTTELNLSEPIIIHLNLSIKEARKRLGNRVECSVTNTTFNKYSEESEKACEAAGGTLNKREDDNEEILTNRFEIYQTKTLPVLDYYRKETIVIDVFGEQPTNNVFNDIITKLKENGYD